MAAVTPAMPAPITITSAAYRIIRPLRRGCEVPSVTRRYHSENEQRLRDIFLPIVDIEHDRQRDLREVGILGIRPLTFFHYQSSPTGFSHSAVLLYKYSVQNEHRRLSAIGLPHFGSGPALSLFALEETQSLNTHRFFPVYQYARDDQANTLNWHVLFVWWHRQTESHVRDFFLPLTDVERDSETNSSRVSLVGLPRMGDLPALTLFNWEQTPSLNTQKVAQNSAYQLEASFEIEQVEPVFLPAPPMGVMQIAEVFESIIMILAAARAHPGTPGVLRQIISDRLQEVADQAAEKSRFFGVHEPIAQRALPSPPLMRVCCRAVIEHLRKMSQYRG